MKIQFDFEFKKILHYKNLDVEFNSGLLENQSDKRKTIATIENMILKIVI